MHMMPADRREEPEPDAVGCWTALFVLVIVSLSIALVLIGAFTVIGWVTE